MEAANGEGYRLESLDEVNAALANGDAVVLFGSDYEGHWVAVQGYDPDSETWLVSDPMSKTGVARWDQDRMAAYYDDSVDSVGVRNPDS